MTSRAAEGLLVGAMWSYAHTVLAPAQALKRAGVAVVGRVEGHEPTGVPAPGLGPRFSVEHSLPVMLESATEHDALVSEFDRMGEVYEAFVRPFSTPILDEAIAVIQAWLAPDARLLDAGCGTGRELRRMARLVPGGEVVGIDLAPGMVSSAHRAARAHGLDHCAFFQADVGAMPNEFEAAFDVVYSSLAHHHYPDPAAATREVLRCVRPGGLYCVIDPGPRWFTTVSAPLAKRTDPGWIGFHTPGQFRQLFETAGFVRTSWRELLPGFGLAVGQKGQL